MGSYNRIEAQEQAELLTAIQNTDICTFLYYPKEKRIAINDRTAQIYACKKEYLDMPKSFADDFVHPTTQPGFYEMYRKIDAGDPTAHPSISSLDQKNWVTVTSPRYLSTVRGFRKRPWA